MSRADTDEDAIEHAENLSSKMIFEIISHEGLEELNRPNRSLLWSGIAAGLLISLSVLGEAIFRTHLPDTPTRHLIENLGYSLGFIVVILGRMQLFTENTITTVLPVMRDPRPQMFGRMLSLWTIVLLSNVVGAFIAAYVFAHTSAIPAELRPAIEALSLHATGFGASEAFQRGIPAGVLIAAIVWMMPESEGFGFFIIVTFTWLIAAGDFTHVIAGSVEMAYLMWLGMLTPFDGIFDFFLPVLAGNILGGTAIFALLAFGQVRNELGKS